MERLKELDLTPDEIHRFSKALKDEKFMEMVHDYARELADPENKKRYEEEIALLERERGNAVEFLHPQPFKALRTSVDGGRKCYINICSDGKVARPECKAWVSEDGRKGQRWSLPHSLQSGREDVDPKGKKVMIYDVIFHPDTLHIAGKNTRFMEMVESTAVQGVQDAFKVTLDRNNARTMKTKYKGTPRACVVRKPIPGFKAQDLSDHPLRFPYPDEKPPRAEPNRPPEAENDTGAETKQFQLKPPQPGPTEPKYTIKYRSVIDIQDFRCSRDSAKTTRPREMVVTIDLPLLKSVTDTVLEVKQKSLLLESEKPAYRLELPLSYPVDEDKGEAKFNKQRGQLTVTLPILAPRQDLSMQVLRKESGPEEVQLEGQESCQEEEEEVRKDQDANIVVEEKWRNPVGVGQPEVVADVEEQADPGEQKKSGEEVGRGPAERHKDDKDSEEQGEETSVQPTGLSTETETSSDDKWPPTANLSVSKEDGETEPGACLVSGPEVTPSDVPHNTETKEDVKEPEAEAGMHTSAEAAGAHARAVDAEDGRTQVPAEDSESKAGGFPERHSPGSKEDQDTDEDDLPTGRIVGAPEPDAKPPPVLLRELDQDGNENIISDHVTSAGFAFQNSMLFELD